jgi:Zn-dependent peptidase ImmA (M78 family)
VATFARTLRFPAAFFARPDIESVNEDIASFRSLASMTAGQRDAALAAGALAIEFAQWIGERFDLPKAQLPDLRHFDPDTAAQMLRNEWRLGERPIKSMIHLLEAKGVRVFALPTESAAVDAFSAWHCGLPFVFLSHAKSGERSRFDAAHELAHLVLHQGGTHGRGTELDADRFASAFLMPHGSVLACAPRRPTLPGLIKLKRNWKVSVEALVVRMRRVNLLTDWEYRRLCIEISGSEHRRREPEPIAKETSQILTKVFASLRANGTSRAAVAKDLAISLADLDAMLFGLVITSVVGGAPTVGPQQAGTGQLKLVK